MRCRARRCGEREAVRVGYRRIGVSDCPPRRRLRRSLVHSIPRACQDADAGAEHEIPGPVVSVVDERNAGADHGTGDSSVQSVSSDDRDCGAAGRRRRHATDVLVAAHGSSRRRWRIARIAGIHDYLGRGRGRRRLLLRRGGGRRRWRRLRRRLLRLIGGRRGRLRERGQRGADERERDEFRHGCLPGVSGTVVAAPPSDNPRPRVRLPGRTTDERADLLPLEAFARSRAWADKE